SVTSEISPVATGRTAVVTSSIGIVDPLGQSQRQVDKSASADQRPGTLAGGSGGRGIASKARLVTPEFVETRARLVGGASQTIGVSTGIEVNQTLFVGPFRRQVDGAEPRAERIRQAARLPVGRNSNNGELGVNEDFVAAADALVDEEPDALARLRSGVDFEHIVDPRRTE